MTPPALPIAGAGPARPAPGGLPTKGMLLADIDQLLGTPRKSTDRMEGRLKVTSRVYSASAGLVTAEFVEGVLIRYTMTSN